MFDFVYLKFDYFISKIKQISDKLWFFFLFYKSDKLWLVKHKMEHKKWDKKFVFNKIL